MGFITIQTVQNILPDIAKTAGSTWGVEVVCLCLIPLFLSVLVLVITLFELGSIVYMSKGLERLLSATLLGSIFVLAGALTVRWLFFERANNFFSEEVFLLVVSTLAYVVSWALLYMLYRADSFKIKSFLFAALSYAIVSEGILWWSFHSGVRHEVVAFVAESMLFVSISIVGIFVHTFGRRVTFFES